ncbi:MAG: GH3 auxin-responsive promoter family protein [Dysgonamonadaceae bacterium]|jgi:hypothetical protein|nr:GH3 auxin-responsive promoter family protein [Dysgonamonadaceae bacterium]
MLSEKIALQLFASRLKGIARFEQYPEVVQSEQFKYLIEKAKNTEWGRKYRYNEIHNYNDFVSRVPVSDYEDIQPYIRRMMEGENNILWPEKICWFAQSSGTTNDKSKFIPVSPSCLQKCHYRGGKDVVSTYLNNVPESKLFGGKALVLGGSHKPMPYNKFVGKGDLSAILIQNINPLANLYRTPSKKIILMDEWESKLEKICKHTVNKNITSLSGVPSWFLVLIKKALEYTGKQYLTDIWPDLEVFFHGGVSFKPYEKQYKTLIPSPQMRYMETYNASEGFFSIQNDFNDPAMLLLLDYGIFFEFIPIEELNSDNPEVYPLEAVETGRNYAIVMSSSNGLWRYKIGDTVMFTGKKPFKIIVTGRTRNFINAFGEELMVDNAERAILKACEKTGGKIHEYTAAPVYMSAEFKGRHQWLIEFITLPHSMDQFALELDNALKGLNTDYEAKRYKNMTLEMPEITIARPNLFYDWLESRGKLGGQHKIPRLSNNRDIIDSVLSLHTT